jgi:CRISPR-associated endonuclease Csn1
MKQILGIDLGVASIGWALVQTDDEKNPQKIIDLGSRIIPLSVDESNEFNSGNSISKNAGRTLKRSMRKGNDRYDLRRKSLKRLLSANNMFPTTEQILKIKPLELFGLRSKAVNEQISLQEFGRILMQLNQRRGYRSSKKDENPDGKVTDYEKAINDRSAFVRDKEQTIGQYFFDELSKDTHFRVKELVFPRAAYINEFDVLWAKQQSFYPEVLTDLLRDDIRNGVIYFQRPLKSQKDLVSFCEFEGAWFPNKEGKMVFGGPKVAPVSSPFAQLSKIWETINNISIKNRKGELYELSIEQKQKVFTHLNENEKLSQTELFKMIGLGKNDGYFANDLISKRGLQGNKTFAVLKAILNDEAETHLLQFHLETVTKQIVDKNTGEFVDGLVIDGKAESEPLYKLWHIIYSVPNEDEIIKILTEKFKIDAVKAMALAKLDFTKSGFAKKSTKAIRKILPYLQQGFMYSDACTMAGYNHSNSVTKEENLFRALKTKIEILPKNSLRQPVVEKILNQLIHIVNDIIAKYGNPTEIRIELARELKQSKDERNRSYKNMGDSQRNHERIRKLLNEHEALRGKKVTKRDIERYKLWEEFDAESPYEPGVKISLSQLFDRGSIDIEHIIPKSKIFDDSFGNKTLCPRRYNSGAGSKNDMTGYDYMKQKRSDEDFEKYVSIIESNKKISYTKRQRLLMSEDKIPKDFIARQLRETSYISRKAREILMPVSYHVLATAGSVTERLRKLWGWEDALMFAQLEKYRLLGKTEIKEWYDQEQKKTKEVIVGWTKRDDHRHHAIDALTVACTQQGFIQRINTLNAKQTRDEMRKDLEGVDYNNNKSQLDNYLLSRKPFKTHEVQEAAEQILVSYKTGKKVATLNKRYQKIDGKKTLLQTGIVVPRGALSEESVYGKIKVPRTKQIKLSTSFSQANEIADANIKVKVLARLAENGNDPAKAFKGLAKKPIWLDEAETEAITAVPVKEMVDEFVIKYKVDQVTEKDLPYVVDGAAKAAIAKRLAEFGNDHKKAYKDLVTKPIWLNEAKGIAIKSVRLFTNISADSLTPITIKDKIQDQQFQKFVKPGSNHHAAIYVDENGKKVEHMVTFWHAVERKKYGIPVVITNPKEVWDKMLVLGVEEQSFLSKLPKDNWTYVTSIQQNEKFIFNMTNEELLDAINKSDKKTLSKNLFRARKISSGQYFLNHHQETMPHESLDAKKAGRCIQASMGSMSGIKVSIDRLGNIAIIDL